MKTKTLKELAETAQHLIAHLVQPEVLYAGIFKQGSHYIAETNATQDLSTVTVDGYFFEIDAYFPNLLGKLDVDFDSALVQKVSRLLRYNGAYCHVTVISIDSKFKVTMVRPRNVHGSVRLRRLLTDATDRVQRDLVYNYKDNCRMSFLQRSEPAHEVIDTEIHGCIAKHFHGSDTVFLLPNATKASVVEVFKYIGAVQTSYLVENYLYVDNTASHEIVNTDFGVADCMYPGTFPVKSEASILAFNNPKTGKLMVEFTVSIA